MTARAASSDDIPLIAPLGITYTSVQVGPAEASGFKNEYEKTSRQAFADMAGMTLYVSNSDAGAGADWHPATPATGAKPGGLWTIVKGGDGSAQWAYRGRPVFTYAKDENVGDANGEGVQDGNGVWRAAVVDLMPLGAAPGGVSELALAQAGGQALATEAGLPLYRFSGTHSASPHCSPSPCGAWAPLVAPAVAHAIGDFSVVDYEPGIRQWAFKGGSLYSYVQDREAGDVKGRAVDPAMEVAFVARDFLPAEAALAANHFGGVSLVSAAGMTLYARDSSGVGSGQNLRVGAHGVPAIGRSLGASACDAECAKTWPPLAAPSDAIACGYWAPIRREDGAPQWSYDGYALYTYSGDRAPGDTNGFGIFRYAEVGEKPKIESTGGVHIAGVPPSSGLTQIHWRMAVP